MIRASTDSKGDVIVDVHLERLPGIYLDQFALAALAKNGLRRKRFLRTFQRQGTLLFSWTNALDVSGPQGRSAAKIGSFLHDLGPHWIPCEINPLNLIKKEQGLVVSNSSPCVSLSFLEGYYPHIHDGPLTLGKVVDLTQEDRDTFQAHLQGIKDILGKFVQTCARQCGGDPTKIDAVLPAYTFDPSKPATYVFEELLRRVMRETKAYKWMPNDGVDLAHATVAASYANLILLDKHWKRRVEALNMPAPYQPRTYYLTELDKFLDDFENHEFVGV